MNKKEAFKSFAQNNKYLVTLVATGKYTWQDLYEIYDIYGADTEIWNKYKKEIKEKDDSTKETVKNLLNNIKNIDTDKLEENISSLQKALGFLEEIVSLRSEKKEEKKVTPKKKNTVVERFFDD